MDNDFWSNIVPLVGILLAIIAFIKNPEYRFYAILCGVALIILLAVNANNDEIVKLKQENRKLTEKLKIYNELIGIKSDIKMFKRCLKK